MRNFLFLWCALSGRHDIRRVSTKEIKKIRTRMSRTLMEWSCLEKDSDTERRYVINGERSRFAGWYHIRRVSTREKNPHKDVEKPDEAKLLKIYIFLNIAWSCFLPQQGGSGRCFCLDWVMPFLLITNPYILSFRFFKDFGANASPRRDSSTTTSPRPQRANEGNWAVKQLRRKKNNSNHPTVIVSITN